MFTSTDWSANDGDIELWFAWNYCLLLFCAYCYRYLTRAEVYLTENGNTINIDENTIFFKPYSNNTQLRNPPNDIGVGHWSNSLQHLKRGRRFFTSVLIALSIAQKCYRQFRNKYRADKANKKLHINELFLCTVGMFEIRQWHASFWLLCIFFLNSANPTSTWKLQLAHAAKSFWWSASCRKARIIGIHSITTAINQNHPNHQRYMNINLNI